MKWWHRVAQREPDFEVGGKADPYMKRWYLTPRNKCGGAYVHQFLHSDDDRALHDHPWFNFSYLLEGEYTEVTIALGGVHHRRIIRAGGFKFRRASAAHRIELHAGTCWTLFIKGPVMREWGFHCPHGWRHWKLYSKPDAKGEIGPGCT